MKCALARACCVLDLDTEAEAHLRDALALTTDRSTRLAVLDDCLPVLVSLGDWTEVLRCADEALRLAPDDTAWLAMRLRALTELHLDARSSVSSAAYHASPGTMPSCIWNMLASARRRGLRSPLSDTSGAD